MKPSSSSQIEGNDSASPQDGRRSKRRMQSLGSARDMSRGPTLGRGSSSHEADAELLALIPGSPMVPPGYDFDAVGSPTKPREPPPTWRSCLAREPLLVFTLIGVVTGIVLGAALRPAHLGATAISLVALPGDLLLRLLKMLVLPLVAASMVSGVCSLAETGSAQNMRRLAKLTAGFYGASTLLAIVLGLALVTTIQPGKNAAFEKVVAKGGKCRVAAEAAAVKPAAASPPIAQAKGGNAAGHSTVQALLRVSHLVIPDNVVQAAVDTNVLGVITFSLLLGWALVSLGPSAEPVIAVVHVLNAAVGKMVTLALWASPIGVGCLVAGSILTACDLGATAAALGWWMVTVVAGLTLFAVVLMPAVLVAATRRSPVAVVSHFSQALALAFGTSSSAASLPMAMAGAREAGCDPGVIAFFIPLGLAVNMCGTALYEATTAVFIAQAHNVPLGPAELAVVAVTASLAAVGAPAIPSAGLVTMMIVLQAVGLDAFSGDLAVILGADWILDRLRTCVNLLADAFGCVIVDHLLKEHGGGGGSLPEVDGREVELGGNGWNGRTPSNGRERGGRQQVWSGATSGPLGQPVHSGEQAITTRV